MCAGQLPLPLQVQSLPFSTLLLPLEKELIRMHQVGSLVIGFQATSANGRHQQISARGCRGCASLPKTIALSGGPFL